MGVVYVGVEIRFALCVKLILVVKTRSARRDRRRYSGGYMQIQLKNRYGFWVVNSDQD
jgi:hypothetical protein